MRQAAFSLRLPPSIVGMYSYFSIASEQSARIGLAPEGATCAGPRCGTHLLLLEIFGLHLIGYAGAVIGTLSYLVHQPRRTLVLHAVSWALWGSYYGSLGGLSGVIVAIVGIISCAAGAVAGRAMLRRVSQFSLVVIWGAGLAMATEAPWHTAVIAPLIATTIEVGSLALRDKPIGFRVAAVFSNMAWVAFGISIGALAGIVFGVVNIAVMFCTIALIWANRPAVTAAN